MFNSNRTVATSFTLWMGAIATALIELVVKLAVEPGGFIYAVTASGKELAVRFTAYAVLLTLSLLMLTGRSWASWALLAIFGGLGTFSLVFEPIGWLLDGGSATGFLASANLAMWTMILSRIAHIACVWAAIFFMFRPAARAHFRRDGV
jgi:hypothetical protein